MAKMTALRALLGGLGGVALGYGKQQELEQERERQRVTRDLQMAQLGLSRRGARPSAAASTTAAPAPPSAAAAAPSAMTAPAAPRETPRSPVATALEAAPALGGGDLISGVRSRMMGAGGDGTESFLSGYSDVRPTYDIGGETYEGISPREEAREDYQQMMAQSRLQSQASLEKRLIDNAQAYMTGSVMFPDKFAELPFDPMVDYKEIYDTEIQAEKDFATLSQQFGKEASDRLRNVRNDYNNRAVIKDGQTRSTFLKAAISAAEAGLAAEEEGNETLQRASDVSLLYSYITSLDPGSVVREGEVILVNRASSLTDRLSVFIQQLNRGGLLSPEMRRSLRADSIERAKDFRQDFQDVNAREAEYLNAQGVDPSLIIFDPYEWVSEYDSDVLDNY